MEADSSHQAADAAGRSDAELLADWRAGTGGAFTELVKRHQTSLLHHARSLLGATEADDAVQEAFLKLAEKPPAVEGDHEASRKQLSSWLHRVTRNLCMDAMRSETRRKRREERAASSEATGGGIDAVETSDTREAVERGLQRLPEAQREVLVLRLLGDKSYREIAEVTGRKVGTVGWLISEGLKQLSGELAHLVPAGARVDARNA